VEYSGGGAGEWRGRAGWRGRSTRVSGEGVGRGGQTVPEKKSCFWEGVRVSVEDDMLV